MGELAGKLSDPQSLKHVDAAKTEMNKAISLLDEAETIGPAAKSDLEEALQSERNAFAALLRLRARETKIVKSRQQSSGQGGQQKKKRSINELELKQDENRYETQSQARSTPQQQEEDRELRQVLNRLRELAQRQADLNEELAELQSAIQLADTKEEEESLQRQLKRLREQQQDLLRDADEAAQRAGGGLE